MLFNLSVIDWGAISALSTIGIALLGFLISRGLKAQEKQREDYTLLIEYRREVVSFSSRFFSLTADAISFHDSDKEDLAESARIAAQLSAMLDEGRFLFPNYVTDEFGKEKGPAFEGKRRPALDAIMAAQCATLALNKGSKSADYIESAAAEIEKTGQPKSLEYDPKSIRSILVESRRAYLNSIFHSTFPREWHMRFQKLLGTVNRNVASPGQPQRG